jgi:protein phosphatase
MRVTCAAATDTGVRRSGNEDAYCLRPDLGLFVVADGMGGHAAGEVAARLAVQEIERVVASSPAGAARETRTLDPDSTDAGGRTGAVTLIEAFREANRRIREEIARELAVRGMATTASALLLDPQGPPVVAHVGDSRIYLLHEGRLRRVTQDHSWVEEQVRAGVIDEAVARSHPWRSVVTRALNGGDDPRVDVLDLPLAPGDRVLICSDGLTAVVTEDRIREAARRAASPEALCGQLIAMANAGGGPDNVTVLAIDVHAA